MIHLPWYVAGPLFGLTVVAVYALANDTLGVSGTYFQLTQWLRRRPETDTWRVWFWLGLVGGALVAVVLLGGPSLSLDYGGLTDVLPAGTAALVLFGAGLLMGFGARWAGGCTSGHGMTGVASRSLGSLAATATFFGTAVVVTQVVHRLSGGAL
jgi:uncharacterized membrane protein YedE/YeeE